MKGSLFDSLVRTFPTAWVSFRPQDQIIASVLSSTTAEKKKWAAAAAAARLKVRRQKNNQEIDSQTDKQQGRSMFMNKCKNWQL